ncbi:MAG: AMP-binding protein [Burkholderiales bacterium]|nr:AMP-binding protein [Burkholderiales bacterium]MDE2564728.1 AMP-binding protein [Burkholderiales bacterium]
MNSQTTLRQLLGTGEDDAIALTAPDRPALSFGALRALVERTGGLLAAQGLGRGDRIAIVLPNGPEMAACFVAVACHAAAAPLNPGYRDEEFAFYLADLKAGALIVAHGSDTPALATARTLGLQVFELQAGAAAGDFTLHPVATAATAARAAGPSDRGPARPEDTAMLLHTSGTTSRPKLVPLSQRNLCASAGHIARTLQLGPGDRGLNIMPLFHIHGLVAGVLAPLAAGSQVCCTPGFNALKFFGWMALARPTWYTAVPTMHQAILARAGHHAELIRRQPLRFIRSSSSSIAPQVIAEIEAVFGAPLIESYGMTEAAHQMASNPLPPRARRPGSVGLAAGPEIAILGEHGGLLAAGETGEVVIRGPNVTAGYEANPEANAAAFVDGWFRTGDQGRLDAEGYLHLTGRLKEIINRGGEKISPREIDEILMDHPALAQVVCFGLPHPRLGEEVAAVVVLREGHGASERELQDFVAARAADFKVPRKILFMDELPKGATGKLQRIGLAARLGLAG